MTDLFRELNELELWDFEIHSFSAVEGGREGVLVVRGSRDFSYYYEAEVRFTEVDYLDLPTHFHFAKFRLATEVEMSELRRRGAFEGTSYAVVVERDSVDERVHFIVAESVEVSVETAPNAEGDADHPDQEAAVRTD